jgi:hypothetical protein
MRLPKLLTVALLTAGLWPAAPASAQTLGTFRWQLQPFCNVVTMTIVQQGIQYQLDGTDDQCGTGRSASLVGRAFVNADQSVSFGFSIVTTPGGTPVHVDAIMLTTGGFSGTWHDSVGNAGNFVFTPGAIVPGAPRPTSASGLPAGSVTNVQLALGTIGVAQINTAEVQQRLVAGSGVSLAGTTISFNGQLGAATEVVRRGLTGTQGAALNWVPDSASTTTNGVWLESGSSEGGGFFANGNTAAIWSPGDVTRRVRNGAVDANGVLFSIFDEDQLTAGNTAPPEFLFANFGTRAIDTFTGAHLTIGGAWTNSSDRNRKHNILRFDSREALARLRAMPIYQWNYNAEAEGVRHVGPMAQDFHAAFGLNGDDDTHIATVDADGVLMASVVAVADESEALRTENARLVQQLAELEARLARIESLLANRPPQ